jgi:hypothetical protein
MCCAAQNRGTCCSVGWVVDKSCDLHSPCDGVRSEGAGVSRSDLGYFDLTILLYDYWALLFLGHLDQARSRRREALTESRRLSPYNRGLALAKRWVGDWTIEDADELLALANEHGFADWGAAGSHAWLVPEYTWSRSGRSAAVLKIAWRTRLWRRSVTIGKRVKPDPFGDRATVEPGLSHNVADGFSLAM